VRDALDDLVGAEPAQVVASGHPRPLVMSSGVFPSWGPR
jgi:hypothetical protein